MSLFKKEKKETININTDSNNNNKLKEINSGNNSNDGKLYILCRRS